MSEPKVSINFVQVLVGKCLLLLFGVQLVLNIFDRIGRTGLSNCTQNLIIGRQYTCCREEKRSIL